MNVIQNEIKIEGFYIYNGLGKTKCFRTLKELEKGLVFLTDYGYNAIGINYSYEDSLPLSVDVLVKCDGDEEFSLSNDIKSRGYLFEGSNAIFEQQLKAIL